MKNSAGQTPLYREEQVEQIFAAYKHVFAYPVPELDKYLDFARERPWSCLTTNFRTVRYEQCLELHQFSASIHGKKSSHAEEAAALANESKRIGVGFSLGICPWTDNLLFETFREDKDELVIVVGHDWYPIAAGEAAESGLLFQGLHHTAKYQRWCPQSFFDAANGPVVLFVNLYPDFRSPGSKKTGRISEAALSYADCARGLQSIVEAVIRKYRSVQIVSWGTPAWSALLPYVSTSAVASGLKQQARLSPGRTLELFGCSYLPMAHPSFASNQNKEHLLKGYEALDFGLPMFVDSRVVSPRFN